MKCIDLQNGLRAMVDDDDYEFTNQWNWWWHGNYVVRDERYGLRKDNKKHRYYLHRAIMGLKPRDKKVVDHINHNPLDNRKANLRIGTQVENQQNRIISRNNSSGYTGVYWHKGGKKWMAYINHGGKMIGLGLYKTTELANKARKKKEKELGWIYALTKGHTHCYRQAGQDKEGSREKASF